MCNMTRQHFQFIADTVGGLINLGFCGDQKGLHEDDLRTVAGRFMVELKKTNPRFDRMRFLKAFEESLLNAKREEMPAPPHYPRQRRAWMDKYDGVPADTHSQ